MDSLVEVYVVYSKEHYLNNNYDREYYCSIHGVFFDEEEAKTWAKDQNFCWQVKSTRLRGIGGKNPMKVKIELSQDNVEEAIKFWLKANGYNVSSLKLDITDDEGSLCNNYEVSARAEVAAKK